MLSNYREYGLYSISLILFERIFSAVIAALTTLQSELLQPGQVLGAIYSVVGVFPRIYLALVIAAGVSIFVTYKFRWVVISLPFLWKLLLPYRTSVSGMYLTGFHGSIIEAIRQATIPDWEGVLLTLWYAKVELIAVVYLYLKFVKQYESNKFEVIFASLLLLTLLLRVF